MSDDPSRNSRAFHKVGATPGLVREAWKYLTLGVGTHYVDSDMYTNVVVSEVYDWKTVGTGAQGCLRVSFKRRGEVLRFVEFSANVSGAGGAPVVSQVTSFLKDVSQA